jgi:uncharacterized protein YndB with AHSA1/START domain
MVKIFHNFEIKASAEKVYEAISTLKGLCGWWTKDTTGNPAKDGEIRFGFGNNFNIMHVIESVGNKFVQWEVKSSDFPSGKEWIGTFISFTLEEKENNIASVKFEHSNWQAFTDFYGVCNYHWGIFMVSLKLLCETGKGTPG